MSAAQAKLASIAERLKTQDNRMTENPMFCVQILKRDVGFDSDYATNSSWHNPEQCETVYDDDPGFKKPDGEGWDGPFGYQDRWETVMVAFTEAACNQYLQADGHNLKRSAFRGQTRIYVESFNRCQEMVWIRNQLKNQAFLAIPDKEAA